MTRNYYNFRKTFYIPDEEPATQIVLCSHEGRVKAIKAYIYIYIYIYIYMCVI
jgi:hypothetical protein